MAQKLLSVEMGFNKRYINKKGILTNWNKGGIESIHSYFNADALIVNEDSYELFEAYNTDIEKFKRLVKLESAKT